MTSALVRGRTLDPFAVDRADQHRLKRLDELESITKKRLGILSLSSKERHELHNLQAWRDMHTPKEVDNVQGKSE